MWTNRIIFFLSLLLISTFTLALEQDQNQNSPSQDPKTLEIEQPYLAHTNKPLPYEVIRGTVIQMVLLSTGDFPVAQVSTAIYDNYRNISIPVLSRMSGKYIGKRGNRHVVKWDRLMLPEMAESLIIEPTLMATMPDGSTGIVDFEPGQRVATLVNEPFIVPHRQ
jgi:type IV secretory pathway VirB10-like protein